MACRTVAIPMTLSDLRGDAANQGLLKCSSSYIYAAVNKTSTVMEPHVVPVQS